MSSALQASARSLGFLMGYSIQASRVTYCIEKTANPAKYRTLFLDGF